MPASRPTKLRMLHRTAPGVGAFATSDSCGQLLVYVTSLPGRSVWAAQEVHQKNAAMSCCFAGSVSAPAGIAYSLRPALKTLTKDGGRLVNLASSGHRFSNVDLNDPNFEATPYEPFLAYGRSKTANILFAVAFDQRHRERGVRAAAVHPGGIQTELARHMDPAQMEQMVKQINEEAAAEGKEPFQFKTVLHGAATSVWAAVVAPAEEVGGRYCENCHVSDVVADDARLGLLDEGVRGYALDPENAKALWKKSEEMVGESFA